MYIYIYIYTHTHYYYVMFSIDVYTYIYIYTYIHLCVFICIDTHTRRKNTRTPGTSTGRRATLAAVRARSSWPRLGAEVRNPVKHFAYSVKTLQYFHEPESCFFSTVFCGFGEGAVVLAKAWCRTQMESNS